MNLNFNLVCWQLIIYAIIQLNQRILCDNYCENKSSDTVCNIFIE